MLESHSCTLTLKLLDKHNLLRHIETTSKDLNVFISIEDAKKFIVKMILATDMACHFTLKDNIHILKENIDHFKQQIEVKEAFQNTISIDVAASERKLKPLFPKKADPFNYFEDHYFHTQNKSPTCKHWDKKESILNPQERSMMCKILIHAADISNPCRPWPVFHQQSSLVCVEFFRQGEEELRLGLPVSSNMNPREANPSTINVGFIDFIVQPYFEALSSLFPKSKELLTQCAINRQEWLKLSSEQIDIFGNKLLPIEMTLGGPTTEVTIAAGTVQIPGPFEIDIRNKLNCRRQSLQPTWISLKGHDHLKLRRKSEEISLLNHRNLASITKGRRKSDELSFSINQPKMVSLLGYE